MTTEEKRQLLIEFQKYWNLNRYETYNILGIDIKNFIDTLPDEGENRCDHLTSEKFINQDGHEYCGRCFTIFN